MLLISVQHAGLLGGICTILFLACACSGKECEYYAMGSSYGIAQACVVVGCSLFTYAVNVIRCLGCDCSSHKGGVL